MKNNAFYSAVAIMIGTVIGAGIFGLPYAVSKIGFIPGLFYLVILGLVYLLITLIYGEVVLRTKEYHRLPGYAEKYLGKWGKRVTIFSSIFGLYGAILAYTIGVGDFLFSLFGRILGGNSFFYSTIFFILGCLAVLAGIKIISKIELFMVGLVLSVIIFLFFYSFSSINLNNLITIDFKNFFLPYGIILFAMAATDAVPAMRKVLKGNEGLLKKSILIGMFFPLIVYIIFVFVVVGVSGAETTEQAVTGLSLFLGERILIIGAILGVLTMSTSFLILGFALQEIFQYDYKIRKISAWLLSFLIPFGIFVLNLFGFAEVIGITGAITGGFLSIIVILMYKKAKKEGNRKPEFSINIPKILVYLIILAFAFGIIYQIIYSF